MKISVFFDGGCSMKRGIAAGAAVAYDDAGVELGYSSKFLINVTTPVAEYIALTLGLLLAHQMGATHVRFFGDAELIVRQVDGRYRTRDPKLLALRDLVHTLMGNFESCEVLELPKAGPKSKRRYLNERADFIAGECMRQGVDLRGGDAHEAPAGQAT